MKRLACLTAVGSLSLALLAVAPAAAPARGIQSTSASIQIVNQAQLQENGKVTLSLVYTCLPGPLGSEGELEAVVEQSEAQGRSMRVPATCDDQKHKVTVEVGPALPKPFSPGTAAAGAAVTNHGVSEADTFSEINIR